MANNITIFIILTLRALLPTLCWPKNCAGQTYDQVSNIYADKVKNPKYSTEIRPLYNQSKAILVSVSFSLVSLVEVDDVFQKFTINGYLVFSWMDEILAWAPEDYGGVTTIFPKLTEVWKPRLLLLNTLQDRDPFGDAMSPLYLSYNGQVEWYPGGLMSASCDLDMKKFPFDVQMCLLKFMAMNGVQDKTEFNASNKNVDKLWFRENSEWKIESTAVTSLTVDSVSTLTYTVVLKRRSPSFVITVLLPVNLLSFLNFFVYVIPVEGAANVQYGITVMLAQAVYMTTLSDRLPRSSQHVPHIATYIFCLFTMAVFNVLVAIFHVYLHRMKMKPPDERQRFYGDVNSLSKNGQDKSSSGNPPRGSESVKINNIQNGGVLFSALHESRNMRKWMNISSLAVSSITYAAVTCWFFTSVLI